MIAYKMTFIACMVDHTWQTHTQVIEFIDSRAVTDYDLRCSWAISTFKHKRADIQYAFVLNTESV